MGFRTRLWIAMLAALSGSMGMPSLAEEASQDKKPHVETDILIEGAPALMVAPPAGARLFNREVIANRLERGTFSWVASEMSFEGRPVKGAPYSAEVVTETTQTLSDGNRIQRKNSASVYRDSEGRTRREQTLTGIGPWSIAGDAPQTIIINDPVAGVQYVLNPKDKTAQKISAPVPYPAVAAAPVESGTVTGPVRVQRALPPPAAPGAGIAVSEFHVFDQNVPKPQSESLGKRVIEGIEAEGTRTTTTIPAGQIGNELPIQIVSERWFSPELQVVVLSRHHDPRMGETVYRLTNISRSEQPRSLFEVPADYAIKEGEPMFRRFQMRKKPADSGN